METFEVLEKALGLIEREEDWTANGAIALSPFHGNCAMTAVNSSTGGSKVGFRAAREALVTVAAQLLDCDPHPRLVVHFNDTHSHAEVVALFKKAIASEKAKAGVYLDLPATQPVHVAAGMEKP